MGKKLSYKTAGVDIDVADATKKGMAKALETTNARVLNRLGAFASLFDIKFSGYNHPVLVLKTEEPGSKQKLAFKYGRVKSICFDMINHLVNDIAVMGATPLSVQDCIVCGRLESEVVTEIVEGIAEACRAQGCVLTGGETSEQPGVLEQGTYILTSSIVGIVDKARIIDGSKCKEGDVVLCLPSSGIHTNGYSLVRALIDQKPEILNTKVEGEPFIEVILTPHLCYYQALKEIYSDVVALAHITGGGIAGNLNRVLPAGLDAKIDLSSIKILPIFKALRREGELADEDLLKTFNLGVGMTAVVRPDMVEKVVSHLTKAGHETYVLGELIKGKQEVVYTGKLSW